jgi:glucosyl-dolichyl phosphate glucuronosyltransferase
VPRNSVSIIIPTRDRSASLKETLSALGGTAVPDDSEVEVLVVDNGSADRTRPVVRQARLWGQAPRYIYEPRAGTSNARNAGLAAARGQVLLWSDDDVAPNRNWIETMCRPILEGRADAVAGRVKLPDSLERPWLQPWHRLCLAVDDRQGAGPTPCRVPSGWLPAPCQLIGANMAFARRVLDKVPAFDAGLGGGALGCGEDTLFSLQLREAGLRIVAGDEGTTVEHHCGEHRLARPFLEDVLASQGRSHAYIDYHWRHHPVLLPRFRGGKSLLALAGLQVLRRLPGAGDPVIGRREARWLWRFAYHQQMAIESRHPRHYEQFGLRPLTAANTFEPHFPGRKLVVARALESRL